MIVIYIIFLFYFTTNGFIRYGAECAIYIYIYDRTILLNDVEQKLNSSESIKSKLLELHKEAKIYSAYIL